MHADLFPHVCLVQVDLFETPPTHNLHVFITRHLIFQHAMCLTFVMSLTTFSFSCPDSLPMAIVLAIPPISIQRTFHDVLLADRQLSELHTCLQSLIDLCDHLTDLNANAALPFINQSIQCLQGAIAIVERHQLRSWLHLRNFLALHGHRWGEPPFLEFQFQ